MDESTYQYVNEQYISSSLICPICLDVLEDPYVHLHCDSAFCHRCLVQLTKPFCPLCRAYWGDFIPWEGSRYVPKASRLIRNMLDELLVQCRQCRTIYRRGQWQHQCVTEVEENLSRPAPPSSNKISAMVSRLMILLWMFVMFYYRESIFVPIMDPPSVRIRNIATNIDGYLLSTIFYLMETIIAYLIPVLILHLCLWLSIRYYERQSTSKISSQKFKQFLEVSIIFYLITYSIFY